MKPKILIIDDDHDFVEDLRLLLDGQFTVSAAFDESTGMQIVRGDPPDVILLDLMLGSSNGLDVLKKMGCIKRSAVDSKKWWLREWVRVSYK